MITYSHEKLTHFLCSVCEKWWSIGDWMNDGNAMFCPYCGTPGTTIPISDLAIAQDNKEEAMK